MNREENKPIRTSILDVGLPKNIRACLFDLDGVLTDTASLHSQAWKQMFDEYLQPRAKKEGKPFVPFDRVVDFEKYVNGKPRAEGTRSFLASRGINLPDGSEKDPAAAETIHGLGERKDAFLHKLMREQGIEPFPGSVRFLHAVREAGIRTAVVSSSRNCSAVVAAAKIGDLFDARVDGAMADEKHLAGKPAPDTYLFAAHELHVDAADAAVFEDAPAGVAAGHAGHFGCVVGVDRVGDADELRESGATIVVHDLAELLRDS